LKSSRHSKIRQIGPAHWDILEGKSPRHAAKEIPEVDHREWCFDSISPAELVYAYWHHWTRIRSQKSDSKLAQAVLKSRSHAHDPTSFDALLEVALSFDGVANLIWRQLIAFPEWPEHPWLSIPASERDRRLTKLFPDYYPPNALNNILFPAQMPPDLVEQLQAASRASGLPVITIFDDVQDQTVQEDLIDQTSEQASLALIDLKDLIDQTEQVSLALLKLDWTLSDKAIVKSFRNLLTRLRPMSSDKPDPPKQGLEYRTKYNLKSLGVYYLLETRRLSLSDAMKVTRAHLGHALYADRREWNRVLKHAFSLVESL
jgi:hypothetical protein